MRSINKHIYQQTTTITESTQSISAPLSSIAKIREIEDKKEVNAVALSSLINILDELANPSVAAYLE